MKRLIGFIGILWVVICSHASDYTLLPIATQSQLPVAELHNLIQDSEGYMWYATGDGGLCRDNGYHIDVFRSDKHHPTLIGKSNYIHELAEGWDGRIFFSNNDGLYVLDKKDYSIRSVDEELRGLTVEPIMFASDSTLWASAGKIIYHYDKELRRIGIYSSQWENESLYPIRIMEDHSGTIWVSQWGGGILRYDATTNSWQPQYWDKKIIPTTIIEEPTGEMWVATWGEGIVRYIPDEKKIIPQVSALSEDEYSNQIIQMVYDEKHRRIFASTMFGLRAFDITVSGLKPYDLSDILPEGMGITDYLNFDNNGNLWVAGFPPHSFILSPRKDEIRRHDFADIKKQLNNRFVAWKSVDEEDYIWLGLDRVLLCLYHVPTGRLSFGTEANIPNYIDMNGADFCRCRQQKGIWSYAGRDVYHIWHEGMRIHAKKIATVADIVLSLYDDGRGNLFIGHLKGLDCLDTHSNLLTSIPTRAEHIKDVIRSKDGNLYCCSGNHHLIRLDSLYLEHVISDIGDFTSVAISPQGIVWATDRQGDLVRYDPTTNSCNIVMLESSQEGRYIRSMDIDSCGNLWLLSNFELVEYNPEKESYHIFSSSDNDIRMDYMYNVSCEGERIRIDGAGALVDFYAKEHTPSSAPPKPVITAYTIDDEEHFIGIGTTRIDFPSSAQNLGLQFSTLNHLNSRKTTYAYRFPQIDKQWHYLSQGANAVSISQLQPGHYQFQLKATDEFGRWGEAVTAINIHRIPAWYQTWWALCLYVLIAVLLIALIVRSYIVSNRYKQEQLLDRRVTELKLRFYTNISHELRTPLTLIITPLQSLIQHIENINKDTLLDSLSLIEDNAKRLLVLVNRLLDFRKTEMGQMKLELTKGNFGIFIQTICDTFKPIAIEKNISFGSVIPEGEHSFYFDQEKVQQIVTNLLSNAFKFTPAGGQIMLIVTFPDMNHVQVTVKDTGCGISNKDLPHIFERFYQSKNDNNLSEAGTGIGLNMVKEWVNIHKGEVHVESTQGKGSTFIVTLPTDLEGEDTQLLPVSNTDTDNQEDESTVSSTPHAATILVTDDNDSFRRYLCRELRTRYHVLSARDGKEALSIIESNTIDILISDVMMPTVDGLSLCKTIKQDVNTSHIMVILLTAKTGDEARLEGYKAGADEYISKPFNMEILQLRINRLLQIRQQRSEVFAAEGEVVIDELKGINEIDRSFLLHAQDTVEQNLSNEQYNMDEFASDMCMSRSTLYRKLLLLTGQKPTEYIRVIRLKAAARMIREQKYPLTEICYMCGFSSTSYFYRCFKKFFGVQPGAYK